MFELSADNIALNIVITGRGTVWVDDIALTKAPRSHAPQTPRLDRLAR